LLVQLSIRDEEISEMTLHIHSFRRIAAQIEDESHRMTDSFNAVELAVKMRSAQIRQIVNVQESNLLRELQSLRSAGQTSPRFSRPTQPSIPPGYVNRVPVCLVLRGSENEECADQADSERSGE